ncbi:4830_t:CDS:2 [Rhizophagus irregularis]|nr:4830_t:CDS:2 [Rhizophagus irregularis]
MIASATFLLIFLASYCNANDSRHIDLEFEDDTYTNYSEIPKLDDTRIYGPYATRDFYIVLIFGLSALLVNLLGSLYVIYRTYIQLRRVGKNNVPLSLRFPFYIALTDTFLSLVFTANLGYTIIRKLPWPNPACKIFGASVSTLFALNIFLVGLVALTTWSCVCREYYIEFGTYDYRLWGVLLKIRSNDNMLISSYQRPVEKRALRKLISYIFTFLLQFIPLLTYYFFTLAEIESILLDVLAITTINFGGIGNFVQFAINEGLNSNKLNSPSSTMDQNMQQESSVVSKPIISVTTHEITVVNNINESDLTQNDINDIVCYNNRLPSEPDKNTIDINRGIIDENDLSNNDDDVLTVFDGTNLVSANSQNVLLNDDHDFQEEIKEYTSHCSSS